MVIEKSTMAGTLEPGEGMEVNVSSNVTTPGDCVDVLVTDYGITVNPLRPDIIECLDKAGIQHVTIESLREKAYDLVGEPDPLQWEDQVVAIVEARDGTILDVVRKIKPYTFLWYTGRNSLHHGVGVVQPPPSRCPPDICI